MNNLKILVLALCIVVATVVFSFILPQGFFKRAKLTKPTIDATDSSQKDLKNFYFIWKGFFVRRRALPADAYKQLQGDLEQVKKYLIEKGVSEKDIIVTQITTRPDHRKEGEFKRTKDIQSYTLKQGIEFHSNDFDKIARISRDYMKLADKGVSIGFSIECYGSGRLGGGEGCKNGRLDGVFKSYYDNRQLESEQFYKDGSLEGSSKRYYANGKLLEEVTYKNGIEEGPFRSYYESGRLRKEGVYKSREFDGLIKSYYENGQLESEGVYEEGRPEGPFKEYDENGSLKK